MSCVKCNHRWCWVCGLPLSHWSHKFSEFLPFSCKRAPNTGFGWFCQFFLFLIGFIILPIFIFGVSFGGSVYGIMYSVLRCHCIRYGCRTSSNYCCCFLKFLFVIMPLIIICFALSLATGAVASVLATGLGTLPAFIFHTYYFIRSCYWWCKTSRVKD